MCSTHLVVTGSCEERVREREREQLHSDREQRPIGREAPAIGLKLTHNGGQEVANTDTKLS